MSRRVRVSVMVNPGAPLLALHDSPSGMVIVLGLVGAEGGVWGDVAA
jgi:hypothetical protein